MSRIPFDAYMTPPEVCETLVSALGVRADKVLEPCCGTGNFVRAYRAYHPSADIFTCDIQPKFFCDSAVAHLPGDFLEAPPSINPPFDLVIGNPPYKTAPEFIEAAMSRLRPSGHLAFLLRMGFLASRKRFALLEKWKPSRVITLAGRPSFTGEGNDRYDYAFIVWPRMPPKHTLWEHIQCPPRGGKRAQPVQ
jgi:tRNA1(Val) A37 N6-methylase TrmN6